MSPSLANIQLYNRRLSTKWCSPHDLMWGWWVLRRAYKVVWVWLHDKALHASPTNPPQNSKLAMDPPLFQLPTTTINSSPCLPSGERSITGNAYLILPPPLPSLHLYHLHTNHHLPFWNPSSSSFSHLRAGSLMAACLPNLSSPGRERRLSELLQEQQEPFLLDVYLLEKGYSDKLLASPATSLCWPINGACKRLQRIASHGLRRSCWRRRRCQLLKCMLAKFLSGRVVRQAFLRRDKKVLHLSEADEVLSLSSRCSDGGEIPWKSHEVDDPKQLSPVSVLELHSYEGSPVHPTSEF